MPEGYLKDSSDTVLEADNDVPSFVTALVMQRIMSVQYHIPPYVRLSPECKHLLSRIFTANPMKVHLRPAPCLGVSVYVCLISFSCSSCSASCCCTVSGVFPATWSLSATGVQRITTLEIKRRLTGS